MQPTTTLFSQVQPLHQWQKPWNRLPDHSLSDNYPLLHNLSIHSETQSWQKQTEGTLRKESGRVSVKRGEQEDDWVKLPVSIHREGRSGHFLWNGEELRLVGFRSGWPEFDAYGDLSGFIRGWIALLTGGLRKLFIPRDVGENYIHYLKWKFVHRVFSSSLQVLATQAMFRAIGFGSYRSLPSAAALNWVLKDGLGRFSRFIYTAYSGSAFDTNLKRVRFSTSIIFSLSIGIELLTPVFPQYFLLLATCANVGKSISLAAYIATSSSIHRSFAVVDNLGEVSAKSQIQTVCFDNLGLLLAAILNFMWKDIPRSQVVLPIVVYPAFAAIDLFAIFEGLKHVHLQTLTKERLEIIVDTWDRSGKIPSPSDVSNREEICFPFVKDD